MGKLAYGWMDIDGYMGEGEFCDDGYLFEANRQFFHLLGLQLVAQVGDDDLRLRVLDRRQTPAGLVYEPVEDEELVYARRAKVERIAIAWEKRAQRRLKRYGYIIQPAAELWNSGGCGVCAESRCGV